MSQRLQVIRRDVISWILPPRPAGPDRHPAPASAGLAGPALAGEAGSATSPKKNTELNEAEPSDLYVTVC